MCHSHCPPGYALPLHSLSDMSPTACLFLLSLVTHQTYQWRFPPLAHLQCLPMPCHPLCVHPFILYLIIEPTVQVPLVLSLGHAIIVHTFSDHICLAHTPLCHLSDMSSTELSIHVHNIHKIHLFKVYMHLSYVFHCSLISQRCCRNGTQKCRKPSSSKNSLHSNRSAVVLIWKIGPVFVVDSLSSGLSVQAHYQACQPMHPSVRIWRRFLLMLLANDRNRSVSGCTGTMGLVTTVLPIIRL